MTLALAAVIGLAVGFLGGLLGKGGSAIATPMLHAIGVPAIVAVAAPLPATIPSTIVAGYAYSREKLVDWRVFRWSVWFGVPSTVFGALLTRWISGGSLVKVTDVVLIALGIRLVLGALEAKPEVPLVVHSPGWQLAVVAVAVGVVSGLLANSGGFLLAPLFMAVLRLPVKSALASSLAVASVLALPGTIVHAALGHMNWTIVLVFGSTSVPLSFLGARTALRTDPQHLERIYGGALIVLGAVFLIIS